MTDDRLTTDGLPTLYRRFLRVMRSLKRKSRPDNRRSRPKRNVKQTCYCTNCEGVLSFRPRTIAVHKRKYGEVIAVAARSDEDGHNVDDAGDFQMDADDDPLPLQLYSAASSTMIVQPGLLDIKVNPPIDCDRYVIVHANHMH